MLCILAVFLPSFFMQGAAQSLFVPLSLAVGFAMIASFLLSSSLVPVLAVWLLGRARGVLTKEQERTLVAELVAAPGQMAEALNREAQIEPVARPFHRLPGWASPEQAWAQTQGQLAWYRAMEERGSVCLRMWCGVWQEAQVAATARPFRRRPSPCMLSEKFSRMWSWWIARSFWTFVPSWWHFPQT